MKKNLFATIFILLLLSSCKEKSANDIINTAIKAHGGASYDSLHISFLFRKNRYTIDLRNEFPIYKKLSTDSAGASVEDMLSKDELTRSINGIPALLADSAMFRAKESLNSVTYFMLLPYKLKDPAVIATKAGQIEIDGKLYDKISVRFKKENGGTDFGDVYCYWFDVATHQLDYLSYSNGGPRFRKVKKRSTFMGVTFQDYENYIINDTTIPSHKYDSAFLQHKATLLSIIKQEGYQLIK